MSFLTRAGPISSKTTAQDWIVSHALEQTVGHSFSKSAIAVETNYHRINRAVLVNGCKLASICFDIKSSTAVNTDGCILMWCQNKLASSAAVTVIN
jgi:hypothetical protein